LKTIKQLAEEIGVTKQALQKRIAREPLHTSLCPCLHTKGNTKYIDVYGENLIKMAFNKDMSTSSIPTSTDKNIDAGIDEGIDKTNSENELYKILKSELESKNNQIAEQQQTINKLMDRLADAQQSEQTAQLLHGGTIQTQLVGNETPPIYTATTTNGGEGLISFKSRVKILFTGKM